MEPKMLVSTSPLHGAGGEKEKKIVSPLEISKPVAVLTWVVCLRNLYYLKKQKHKKPPKLKIKGILGW